MEFPKFMPSRTTERALDTEILQASHEMFGAGDDLVTCLRGDESRRDELRRGTG